jgi:alpha-D-xyloside xylohydrolase
MLYTDPRKSYSIVKTERVNDSLILTSERGILRISPQNANIIRINYSENGALSEEYGLGIVFRGSYSDWKFSETPMDVTVTTSEISLTVNKKTSSISYFDISGNLLLKEADFQSKYICYYDTTQTVADENTVVEEIETPDGIKKTIKQATKVFDRRLCNTKLSLQFKDDEKIYGLGQSPDGALNLRGTTQYIHQANMKIAIPFFLSTEGYGILSGTDGTAIFNDNADGAYLFTDADTEMDFYFIYGPEFDDIIKGYRFLTGKAVMLPKWAFGYIQSQERYESQKEIIDTVEKFESLGLGLDCIVQDWSSWIPGHWGEKRLDPEAFPDVPEMIRTLDEKNVHFMLSIWANPAACTDDYKEFAEKGMFFPASNTYNAFDPKARATYWKQLKAGVWDKGIKAFWCDSSEPFTPE